MKKNYSFLFVLLIFSFASFAQVNAYFSGNPVWQLKQSIYSGTDLSHTDDDFNYYINGDTSIAGFTYKKIYKKGIASYFSATGMPLGSGPAYINSDPSFFIRSIAKQVYVLELSGTENLLCDYNLSVGDTVSGSITEMSGTRTVVSIDSINTPFGYRKTFVLSGSAVHSGHPYPLLYEGAGSSAGLIEDVSGTMGVSSFSELKCYSLNDTAYIPSSGPSCLLALGISTNQTEPIISVFPNPFFNSVTFEFGSILKNAELNIYTVNGKKISTIAFSGNKISFNREGLPAGFYFYEVISGQQTNFKGKLIVAD